MELLQGRGALDFDLTKTIAAVVSGLVTIWLIYRLLRSDPEKPLTISIPAPEQCARGWIGEALDQPAIKVSGSTAIQCYAPRNWPISRSCQPDDPRWN